MSSSIVSWRCWFEPTAIANPITGTIPKFTRRIPCQKSQVNTSPTERTDSGKRGWDRARCCTSAVDTAARGSSRECAETACGLRERRSAARVELSLEGLAQTINAVSLAGSPLSFSSIGAYPRSHPCAEKFADPQLGPIGANRQTMVQTLDGSAEAAEGFERLEHAKQRRDYADEKLSCSGNLSGITALLVMPALSVPRP